MIYKSYTSHNNKVKATKYLNLITFLVSIIHVYKTLLMTGNKPIKPKLLKIKDKVTEIIIKPIFIF